MRKLWAKGVAVLLSAALMMEASGCGGKTKIDDNGKPIADFDEYINGEWKKEQEEKDRASVKNLDTETNLMNDRVEKILKETDLSGLSEDDGLYKTVLFYNQFTDTSDIETKINTIKEHLAPIEEVTSLEDLYSLYEDEEYAHFNKILKYNVVADNGYNVLWFSPESYTGALMYYDGLLTNPSDDKKDAGEKYLAMLESLGFSKDRAVEMIENAGKLGGLIDEYYNTNEDFPCFQKSDLDAKNVSVPVIDILVKLNAFGMKRQVVAKESFCEFLEKVYTPENVELLRDHMLFSAIFELSSIYGEEYLKADYGMDNSAQALLVIKGVAIDVLNKEYQKIYLDENTLNDASAMADDLKDVMRQKISDSEILSTHGKELAKHKIMNMHVNLGLNGDGNYFEDVQMTDNAVENFISILVSRDRFYRRQTIKEDEERDLFNADLYEIDGRYFPNNNAFIVTNGLLGAERIGENSTYEEKLALLGACMAHEIGHSYDRNSIDYDYHAYYEPWMNEEESAAYQEKVQSIIDYFDGMEIEFGEKINGNLVCDEVIADIVSIGCCLDLLEKQDNPDYDLFFRTYAHNWACYYTKEGAAEAVKDEHLPGKQRINCILGQFDKFYEIYDIDESSPFYVPEENRISSIF